MEENKIEQAAAQNGVTVEEFNSLREQLKRLSEEYNNKISSDLSPENKSLKDIINDENKKQNEQNELEELRKYKAENDKKAQLNEVLEALSAKDLPIDTVIAAALIGSDAEETNKALKSFEKAFKKSVDAAVDKRLAENGFSQPKKAQTEDLDLSDNGKIQKAFNDGKIDAQTFYNLINKGE